MVKLQREKIKLNLMEKLIGLKKIKTAIFISGTGSNLKKINKFFSKEFKPYVIGKIISGKNKVKLNGKIDWS